MKEKKQIEIKKSSIQRLLKNTLLAYTTTFLLVLSIQHLGSFIEGGFYNTIFIYKSPLTNEYSSYETKIKSKDYSKKKTNRRYMNENGIFKNNPNPRYMNENEVSYEQKYESDITYVQKIKGAYLPSMFIQLKGIQALLTIVFTSAIYIIQSLRKKYKIKLT